jgi:hypothetical protein
MAKASSRLLLALSAAILAVGGLMHASAFDRTLSALAASNLDAFYANSLEALWLIDSATLLALAVVFGLVAARPDLASRPVIILLALVPAATAFFLYKFIGNFVPAHMLLASAIATVLGGVGFGSARSTRRGRADAA